MPPLPNTLQKFSNEDDASMLPGRVVITKAELGEILRHEPAKMLRTERATAMRRTLLALGIAVSRR